MVLVCEVTFNVIKGHIGMKNHTYIFVELKDIYNLLNYGDKKKCGARI